MLSVHLLFVQTFIGMGLSRVQAHVQASIVLHARALRRRLDLRKRQAAGRPEKTRDVDKPWALAGTRLGSWDSAPFLCARRSVFYPIPEDPIAVVAHRCADPEAHAPV